MTSRSLGARPAIAVLCTTYFENSHADVIVPRLVRGYLYQGAHHAPRLRVASVYLEQLGTERDYGYFPDLGVGFLAEHEITRALTVGEALGAGAPGVNVDGVLIIGEHGDYEFNEYGQQLYPRRRLFDAAVAAMVAANRFVPIFNDKGLSYSARDANEIAATASRLGIPLAAGSTVPISWRDPVGAQWPLDTPMEQAVLVGWGPPERYGFHSLEGLQANVERRAGGETGIRSITGLDPVAAQRAVADGTIDFHLLGQAFGVLGLDDAEREDALARIDASILIEYRDGLRAAVVNCNADGQGVINQFGVACRGGEVDFRCLMWLQGAPEHGHFTFLTRQIEDLVLTRSPRIPVQRTILTTGALDAAMRSWATGGDPVATDELAIVYTPQTDFDGTGVFEERPIGSRREG